MTASEAPLELISLPPGHVRVWGDSVALYDSRCGETHVLQPPLTDIFCALRQGPMTPAAVFEYLEQRYDATEEELENAMQAGLSQLREHYLICDPADSRDA
ncbi:HPr-rel-A system PqqD family peptide chaperone [Thioalkalivibrio sp. ALJ16]|uniref:HPr-rel-A system PqqD family peptide chaperone n=1 Tax=Thioalkalivibrio sp. ALJ16 TaxID=1158762 RepID=UPI0004775638|nr:HPr-rel-A system PqqD family peptide chaperone [Thioalkalivibrio sp. ALJ16]